MIDTDTNDAEMAKIVDELVASSAKAHGHLCAGQIVGVRMALLGCRLIGVDIPVSDKQLKKLIIYVEMDRCTGDAVAHVTRVKLGRRSLKYKDYGIMAATFVNMETNKAFRIISTEESRDLAASYAPHVAGALKQQLEAYRLMPDDLLFKVQEVRVDVGEYDLPGPTRRKVTCARCGQVVRDNKERVVDGEPLCQPCAEGAYFKDTKEVDWSDMAWTPPKSRLADPAKRPIVLPTVGRTVVNKK